MIEDIKQLKKGAVISESSHYIIKSCDSEKAVVKHFESGDTTIISLVITALTSALVKEPISIPNCFNVLPKLGIFLTSEALAVEQFTPILYLLKVYWCKDNKIVLSLKVDNNKITLG